MLLGLIDDCDVKPESAVIVLLNLKFPKAMQDAALHLILYFGGD